jgi:hypothetical protein
VEVKLCSALATTPRNLAGSSWAAIVLMLTGAWMPTRAAAWAISRFSLGV